jgi:hypothetical protein
MTAAAERQIQEQTDAFELLHHSMTRITVLGNGTYDEFQARFDAAMPASTPQDVMGAAGTWKNAVALLTLCLLTLLFSSQVPQAA